MLSTDDKMRENDAQFGRMSPKEARKAFKSLQKGVQENKILRIRDKICFL